MARFEIYPNPTAAERRHTPFVMDVQNDHLGQLGSRIAIPLRLASSFGAPARELNPVIQFQGQSLVLDTANLSPVPAQQLKNRLDRLDSEREAVLNALDTLFGSF
jgi:toxin CcdB